MNHTSKVKLVVACLLASAYAAAQPALKTGESLGALLYSTHCGACHTEQIHWRDKKLATDWASLRAQVRRWQSNSGLAWSDEEIAEVTRYLNQRFYHFPETAGQVSSRERPRKQSAAQAPSGWR